MAAQFHTIFVALIAVLTWSANGCSAQAFNQLVTLYAGLNGTGAQSTSFLEAYAPNLASNGFDNQGMSVCGTGVWLFYENPNYNIEQSGLAEFAFMKSEKQCKNFLHVGGKLSSMRFVGNRKEYRADSLTLYEGDYFQGIDETSTGELPNLALNGKVASLIVTGVSPFTLYALPNYEGKAICVNPPPTNDFTPAFIYKITNIGIPKNSVRSFKIGCHAKK